jgi:hypothetical protein
MESFKATWKRFLEEVRLPLISLWKASQPNDTIGRVSGIALGNYSFERITQFNVIGIFMFFFFINFVKHIPLDPLDDAFAGLDFHNDGPSYISSVSALWIAICKYNDLFKIGGVDVERRLSCDKFAESFIQWLFEKNVVRFTIDEMNLCFVDKFRLRNLQDFLDSVNLISKNMPNIYQMYRFLIYIFAQLTCYTPLG